MEVPDTPHLSLTDVEDTQSEVGVASSILLPALIEVDRQFKVKKQIIEGLGQVLDTFVNSFSGDHEVEHRFYARYIAETLVSHLNTAIFANSDGAFYAPIGLQSSPPYPSERPKSSSVTKQFPSAGIAQARHVHSTCTGSTNGAAMKQTSVKYGSTVAGSTTSGRQDKRILIRLSPEGRLNRERPLALRMALIQEFTDIGLQLSDIPEISLIRTGWAVRVSTIQRRDQLLELDNKSRLSRLTNAQAIELPQVWYNYVVQDIPYDFPTLGDPEERIIAATVIDEEVFTQTRRWPVNCRPSRHGLDPVTNEGSWIISFLEPVRPFRLFSTSSLSRQITQKPVIKLHSPGCQGYCNIRRCNRQPRCGQCGHRVDQHTNADEPCNKPAQCANCYGPFPAGHEKCPAAPRKKGDKVILLTKRQLQAVRSTGRMRYEEENNPPGATEGDFWQQQ